MSNYLRGVRLYIYSLTRIHVSRRLQKKDGERGMENLGRAFREDHATRKFQRGNPPHRTHHQRRHPFYRNIHSHQAKIAALMIE